MNEETLKKGLELNKKINDLECNIDHLSAGVNIMIFSSYLGGGQVSVDRISRPTLDTCKLLAEADLKKQLNEAEKEFAEL
jgi:hypothetical protein